MLRSDELLHSPPVVAPNYYRPAHRASYRLGVALLLLHAALRAVKERRTEGRRDGLHANTRSHSCAS
jgi:hypothetical protein